MAEFKKQPIVTRSQLKELLGIDSDRRIDLLAIRKVLVKKGLNQYYLITSWQNYTRILHANLKKHSHTAVGRPKKYNDYRELEVAAAIYFEKCEANAKTPTISGICMHLNIDKKTLLRYGDDPQFSHTVKRIKLAVEEAMEDASLHKSSAAGAIFNLKVNFGFQDKTVIDHNVGGRVTIVELPNNGRGDRNQEDKPST